MTLAFAASLLASGVTLAHSGVASAFEGATVDREPRVPTVAICEGADGACLLRCTGVIIAPRLVLTARHCVTTRKSDRPSCAEDVEGPLLDVARFGVVVGAEIDTSVPLRATALSVPPASEPCGHDLALLTVPSILPATPMEVHVGELPRVVTVAGYGAAGSDGSGSGIRRSIAEVVVTCSGERASCGGPSSGPLVRDELLVEARACAGDSGGGAIVPGSGVAAILSRSIDTGACGRGVYTSLAPNLLWLARAARAIAAVDRSAAPDWVAKAEARGNRDGNGLGANCNEDADCASGLCRSPNGNRSFVCARACDESCGCQSTDRGAACFSRGDGGGCSVAPLPSSRTNEGATLLLGAFAILRRIRRSSGHPLRRTGARTASSDILGGYER